MASSQHWTRFLVRVAAGEAVALWGPNGAGKTTAMKCLLDLLRYAGQITVDGLDAHKQGREARRRIGYVPQQISLYPEMGTLETVQFFATPESSRLRDAAAYSGAGRTGRARGQAGRRALRRHEAAAGAGHRAAGRSARAGAGRTDDQPGCRGARAFPGPGDPTCAGTARRCYSRRTGWRRSNGWPTVCSSCEEGASCRDDQPPVPLRSGLGRAHRRCSCACRLQQVNDALDVLSSQGFDARNGVGVLVEVRPARRRRPIQALRPRVRYRSH